LPHARGIEVHEVAAHQNLERAKTAGAGFVHCLPVGPVVVNHPIAGDQLPSAVGAAAAVHKNWRGGSILHHGKQFGDLSIVGREDSGEALLHILHAGIFHQPPFPGRVQTSATKVDHRLDSHFGQGGKTLGGGLVSAVNIGIHLLEVLQAGFAGEDRNDEDDKRCELSVSEH
jgi:hypothetical protein